MNTFIRWFIVSVLLLFAIICLNKGLDLWSHRTNVDGDGIGVYFLAFEINDKVAEENIPSYAIGFFIASILLFSVSFMLLLKIFKPRQKES